MGKTVVDVQHVSMRFSLSSEKVDNLKEYFIKFVKKEITYNVFWALKDINLKVNKGERLGILGLNGAPLLELGAGFEPQYTGAENIYLYGAVLGYPREFIAEKYDEIVAFSELGKFINVPLKNYSSGMKSRLGFAIATIVEPDILILDEVLAVGDAKFKKKCEAKIQSMFDKGVTVLFVSHSLAQVQKICDKAILLEHGQVIAQGGIDEVSAIYEEKTK